MKPISFGHDEGGQALIVVALAMIVLIGSLALSVDWGYSLLTRRVAQNEADAGALAAGRLLATTFVSSTQPFDPTKATQEMVWTAACYGARRNSTNSATTQSHTLSVWFSADPADPFPADPTGSTWTGVSASSNNCAIGPSGATDVSGGTAYVRVVSSTSYTSLFGVLAPRTPEPRQVVEVAASARVRLTGAGRNTGVVPLAPVGDSSVGIPGLGWSGSSTVPNVPIWPIVIHYDPLVWGSVGTEITLIDWHSRRSPEQEDTSFFVSFAHFSPAEQADPARLQVHQPITESDYTGSGPATGWYGQRHGHPQTAMLPTAPGACGGNPWDTRGFPDPNDAASCDIPNWFYYGYRGSLSIGTQWDDSSWRSLRDIPSPGVEMPDSFRGPRASCTPGYPYFTAPSCPDTSGSSHIGDWVETVTVKTSANPNGVDPTLVARRMTDFVDRYGRVVPATGERAVVVNVFLWDCGERFDGGTFSDPDNRGRWQMVPSGAGSDCSTVTGSLLRSVNRVHLFTVVPLTISMSDIDLTQRRKSVDVFVTARWGNTFGSAGACASVPTPSGCQPNSIMNSAFLVPDD